MATFGYARVSTTGQSLETQREQLQKVGVERIFEEKVSGATRNRPELNQMLDYTREGDTVIITKLDRLARSTKDLLEIVEQLQAKGVTFRVLNSDLDTSTPNGKLMLTMLGAIAEFERALMLERQAEGIAKAKQKGKYKGRKPTARNKTKEVLEMDSKGISKREIAKSLEIGEASVYRILRDNKK